MSRKMTCVTQMTCALIACPISRLAFKSPGAPDAVCYRAVGEHLIWPGFLECRRLVRLAVPVQPVATRSRVKLALEPSKLLQLLPRQNDARGHNVVFSPVPTISMVARHVIERNIIKRKLDARLGRRIVMSATLPALLSSGISIGSGALARTRTGMAANRRILRPKRSAFTHHSRT